jgi:hypothetical protein
MHFFSMTNSNTLVQAHTLYFPHVVPAIECDVSTLLVALQICSGKWLCYVQVNFEGDSQFVVNAIANEDAYVNELARRYFD